jgi:hypothetical protein
MAGSRFFDLLLEQSRSSDLQPMLRMWGGRATRKADMLDFLRQALSDPQRVRAAVAGLEPFERQALALVRWAGGTIDAGSLTVGLRAAGVALPKERGWHDSNDHWLVRALMQRGLVLGGYEHEPTYIPSYGSVHLFSDERLLEHAGPLEPVPLPITPTAPPSDSQSRRPPTVALDIIGVLQAIDGLGGIKLTRAGAPRAGDIRKLARALKWDDKELIVDELVFPDPVLAMLDALSHAGLLSQEDDTLSARGAAERFAQRSYAEQGGDLLRGFLKARAWRESQIEGWYDSNGVHHIQGRIALAVALTALPDAPGAFFAVDDLDQALFERIGENFSLSYPPHPPYLHGKSPEEARREQQKWRMKLRSDWLARERAWVDDALTSWLYYLGLVELGFHGDNLTSFRLTELGRAVLHPSQASELDVPAVANSAAWTIQPDFDLLVYLDRASPAQIMFVERHAERSEAQQHMARYKLTRASIYEGLESGGTLDELLAGLSAGATGEVPQNVQATIREWAAQRERITLRRRASLLEFADTQSRQQALDGGLKGLPVGERFVLFQGKLPAVQPGAYVDYTETMPKSLTATESGTISMTRPALDLLIRPQLDRWAKRTGGDTWQLSAESVAAAIKGGSSIRELQRLLADRLIRSLPALLGVALRGWAGERPAAALAQVVVLRCTQPEVFAAIANSSRMRPFLRGTLAPGLLLVEPNAVAALREQLEWAGFEVGATIEV